MILFKTEYKNGEHQTISINFEKKEFYISNINYFNGEKITLEPKEAQNLITQLEISKFKKINV